MARVVRRQVKKRPAKRRVALPRRDEKPVLTEDEFGAPSGPIRVELAGLDRSRSKSATRELSWSDFDAQVQQLARSAAKRFRPEAVVGLAHGGVFVGGAIASALKVEFFPVRISRRSRDSGSHPELAHDMPRELAGRRVLIVDDVAASGDSLELALRLAKLAGATKLATAALVTRPRGFTPDFSAFTSDTFFVFPWDYQSVVEDARFDPESR